MCSNRFVALHIQTAHAITAIFYFLATEKRSIFDRLRQEVLDVVGPENPLPSFEQVREMKYLRAVINGKFRHECRARDMLVN